MEKAMMWPKSEINNVLRHIDAYRKRKLLLTLIRSARLSIKLSLASISMHWHTCKKQSGVHELFACLKCEVLCWQRTKCLSAHGLKHVVACHSVSASNSGFQIACLSVSGKGTRPCPWWENNIRLLTTQWVTCTLPLILFYATVALL